MPDFDFGIFSKIAELRKKQPVAFADYDSNPLQAWMKMLDLQFAPESPAGRITTRHAEEERLIKLIDKGKRIQ